MDLAKIIDLFEVKHTAQLSDRHAAAIIQLCQEKLGNISTVDLDSSNQNFVYRDLPEVSRIIDHCFNGIQNGKFELISAVLSLLDVLKIPIVKEKSSDETKQVPNLPVLFNSLCPLLRYNIPLVETEGVDLATVYQEYEKVCEEIANTISQIASQGIQDIKDQQATLEDKMIFGAENSPMQRLFKKGNRNLRGIAHSDVPETLVSVLAEAQKSKDTTVAVIEAIAECSVYYENAQKFTNMGVMKDLVRFITEAQDFRSYVVHISIEAIWNLIEVVGQTAIESMADDQEAVLSLRVPFERIIKEGYKYDDKCLRNELAVLINYVATSMQSHSFFLEQDTRNGDDSSFLEFLIRQAIFDELNSSSNQKKFSLSTKDEDIELKKLLWTGILYLVRDPENTQAHQTLIQTGFVKGLLMFIDPSTQAPSIQRYQPAQLCELQIHCLSLLTTIIPLVPEHFHQLNGHMILNQFLANYSDYHRRMSCLKAIQCTSTFDYYKKDYSELKSGLVENLINIIQGGQQQPLDMRELAFNVISYLCKECRGNQKEFRRKGGIEMLKENLAYSEVDQSGNSTTFVLSVLDCLASAVFGNKRSELHFLDIEGVYVLLDLIETCEDSLKRLALASLCTLLENNKSFQYFIEWNSSRSSINATQLLINLYQQEDLRFGVQYSVEGVLQSTERPLVPGESYLKRKYKSVDRQNNHSSTTLGNGQDNRSQDRSQMSKQGSVHEMSVFKDENKSRLSQRSNTTSRSAITNERTINLSSSKAAKSLKKALEAAQALGGAESHLIKLMKEVSYNFDFRLTIFGCFYRVGFDLHDLTSSQKQRMEIIQLYPYLKNGEIWLDIKQELQDTRVQPTMDDRHWMETSIEEAFEQTEKAVHNQSLFSHDMKSKEQDELENYFTTIRLKNQAQTKGPSSKKTIKKK